MYINRVAPYLTLYLLNAFLFMINLIPLCTSQVLKIINAQINTKINFTVINDATNKNKQLSSYLTKT